MTLPPQARKYAVSGSLVIVASAPGGASCEPDDADDAESSQLFITFNASVELRRPSDDLLLTPLLPVWGQLLLRVRPGPPSIF
jgi:hypothetical protein